jgi:tetratricopeptide (TPR) repeat protein
MKLLWVSLLVSVIVVIAGFSVIECRAQGYSADEYKSDIRAALETEDYSKAIILCDNAIKEYPNDADFFYYEGFALAETKQFDKAMEAYRSADKIEPFLINQILDFEDSSAEETYLRGLYYIPNPDQAIKYFLESNRLEPENPMGLSEAAKSYLDKKDYQNSIICLKKAIIIKPDFALVVLARAYFGAKDWEKASFYSKLTLELLPDYKDRNIAEERIKECEKHLSK